MSSLLQKDPKLWELVASTSTYTPVEVEKTTRVVRARSDKPFVLGYLPEDLMTHCFKPHNFVLAQPGLAIPNNVSTTERSEMFKYVDDMMAIRLVSRAFARRYKAYTCLQAVRRQIHSGRCLKQDRRWMFCMHNAALIGCSMGVTIDAQGDAALQHLKSLLIAGAIHRYGANAIFPLMDELRQRNTARNLFVLRDIRQTFSDQ